MSWAEVYEALQNLYYYEGFEEVGLNIEDGYVEIRACARLKEE